MKALSVLRSIKQSIRIWHLLILFVLLVPLSVWQLRENNLMMIELRDKVVEVDSQTGDIAQVEPHLLALGSYVLGHMNTKLAGPIELPGSYNAAVERARQEVEQSGNANGEVYRQAQAICEKPSIPLTARAQCIQEYVLSNAAPGTDAKELMFPDKSLYSYNFASPGWSADLAGLSMLGAILTSTTIVISTIRRFAIPAISHSIDSDPLE